MIDQNWLKCILHCVISCRTIALFSRRTWNGQFRSIRPKSHNAQCEMRSSLGVWWDLRKAIDLVFVRLAGVDCRVARTFPHSQLLQTSWAVRGVSLYWRQVSDTHRNTDWDTISSATHAHAHAHAHAHTHTNTHAHAHIQTHTHAHMHTYKHTHTHARTLLLSYMMGLFKISTFCGLKPDTSLFCTYGPHHFIHGNFGGICFKC